ncbi:ATP phosphoribosyltransferase regulatory subunit [Alicyclobacillus sp. ALC3]|nr:ATP phosphoribosyltransferase regulatory subunit [Alicyclobacillus sp. ALC3]
MRDVFPQQARLRRNVENELLDLFQQTGFDMVSCGAFEYVETLTRGRPVRDIETLVQWFDAAGRTVALRPDMTPSIARMAAPLVANGQGSVQWSYAERVYHRTSDPASLSWASGRAAESTQVGVEWIGARGPEADAHLLRICQRGMEAIGLREWQMVVSHARIAPALLETFDVEQSAIEGLLADLTRGDYVSFQETLRRLGTTRDVLKQFALCDPLKPQTLLALLDPADHRPCAQEVRRAWQELRDLATVLRAMGLAEQVSFDLTLHRDLSYYTGLVFEVFSPGVGAPVAQGGRYDDLLESFGAQAPAVGFTFEVERVLAVLTQGAWLHGHGDGAGIGAEAGKGDGAGDGHEAGQGDGAGDGHEAGHEAGQGDGEGEPC